MSLAPGRCTRKKRGGRGSPAAGTVGGRFAPIFIPRFFWRRAAAACQGRASSRYGPPGHSPPPLLQRLPFRALAWRGPGIHVGEKQARSPVRPAESGPARSGRLLPPCAPGSGPEALVLAAAYLVVQCPSWCWAGRSHPSGDPQPRASAFQPGQRLRLALYDVILAPTPPGLRAP